MYINRTGALGYLIGYVEICPPLQEKSHYVAVAIIGCPI
jgi:hypothetical protein